MSYEAWFGEHAKKHEAIVEKLKAQDFGQDEIIRYFEYENMAKLETWFCPLYADGIKCHEMKNLNCYLCGCPNFRFCDDGLGEYNSKSIKSRCTIHSGKQTAYGDEIHQDCSSCTVAHHEPFVKKNFKESWEEIMRECKV